LSPRCVRATTRNTRATGRSPGGDRRGSGDCRPRIVRPGLPPSSVIATGAITAFVGIFLVLPILVEALPSSIRQSHCQVSAAPHQRPGHCRGLPGPDSSGPHRGSVGSRDRDRPLPDLRLRCVAGCTHTGLQHRPRLYRHGNRTDAHAGGRRGFFIPILFGHLVPHTSYTTGWIFLAAVTIVFAIVGLVGHNPVAHSVPQRTSRGRTKDLVESGIDRARAAVAAGDADIAAPLLDAPANDVRRVAGPRR
jgi:hypothetical protein